MLCLRLAGLMLMAAALPALGADDSLDYLATMPVEVAPFQVSIETVYDDNVTRTDTDILSDQSIRLAAGDTLYLPITPYWRAILAGGAALEQFNHWHGLSHADLNLGASLEYRWDPRFYTPIFAVGVRATGLAYESQLRSGVRTVASLGVTESITDQITGSLFFDHDERQAQNSTFAGHGNNVGVHFEDVLSSRTTAYFTLGRRLGNALTTSCPQLTSNGSSFCGPNPNPSATQIAQGNASSSMVLDPAFGSTDRETFRIEGRSIQATLGLNYAITPLHSIELFWQRVVLLPLPDQNPQPRYVDNQLGVSYLVAF